MEFNGMRRGAGEQREENNHFGVSYMFGLNCD